MQDFYSVKENRGGESPPSIAVAAALWVIRAYKKFVSPHIPAACRYNPTCSEYAEQAVLKYGAIYGGLLSLKRVLRCSRFFKGGHDPLP
jgi:putative membrane protein insertion efficiency factor